MGQSDKGYSICMVFFEEGSSLLNTLDGLRETFNHFKSITDEPTEFLFVDNGTTGLSASYITEFFLSWDFPIKLIQSPQNNMGMARNLGMKAATYNKIIYLDADCRPHKTWLSGYHMALNKLHAECPAAIGGENSPPPGDNFIIYKCVYALKRFPVLHLYSSQISKAGKDQLVKHLPTCNVLYTREALDLVGGFDESFLRVGEDLDLSARLIRHGRKLYFVDGVAVEHAIGTSHRGWFIKVFGYGAAQPAIVFKNAFHVGFFRWIPFFVLAIFCCFVCFNPMYSILLFLGVALALPALTIPWRSSISARFYWPVFLNLTITAYLLGWIAGVGNISVKFLKSKSALKSVAPARLNPNLE